MDLKRMKMALMIVMVLNLLVPMCSSVVFATLGLQFLHLAIFYLILAGNSSNGNIDVIIQNISMTFYITFWD